MVDVDDIILIAPAVIVAAFGAPAVVRGQQAPDGDAQGRQGLHGRVIVERGDVLVGMVQARFQEREELQHGGAGRTDQPRESSVQPVERGAAGALDHVRQFIYLFFIHEVTP